MLKLIQIIQLLLGLEELRPEAVECPVLETTQYLLHQAPVPHWVVVAAM
jgi:hypothetical protein